MLKDVFLYRFNIHWDWKKKQWIQTYKLTNLKVASDQYCAAVIGAQPGYSNSDVTDNMLYAGGEVSKDSLELDRMKAEWRRM